MLGKKKRQKGPDLHPVQNPEHTIVSIKQKMLLDPDLQPVWTQSSPFSVSCNTELDFYLQYVESISIYYWLLSSILHFLTIALENET